MSGIILGFITVVFNVIYHNDLAKEGKIKSKIWQTIKKYQFSLVIKM